MERPTIPALCSLCGGRATLKFKYMVNGCTVLRCSACGVGCAQPLVEFDPATYYTASYFNGGHADGYSSYVENAAVRRREFAMTLDYLCTLVPPGGRLLEVGCAYGYFLEQAQRRFECYGIELAADAVKACHERGLSSVRHGAVSAALLREIGPVDVVVLLDVIEHLEDPLTVVVELASRLRPGGVILITTGDFSSPFARLTGKRWRLLTPPQHLWFFSPSSMASMASTAGLSVAAIDHPAKFAPLSMALRKVGKLVGLDFNAEGALSRIGIPINLGDAMRVALRK